MEKSKWKLVLIVVIFLALVPFRLPISVILINLFDNILNLCSMKLPFNVMQTNIVITKIVYNIVLSSYFVYNIEMLSRKILGRKAYDGTSTPAEMFFWSVIISFLLFVFIIIDAFAIAEIYHFNTYKQ